jgi:hypothetical protein
MKKFKEFISEAFFKVNIPNMKPTFIEAGSAGEVKADLRKKFKPAHFKELEVERVTPSAMKQMYRDMAKGKEGEDEPVEEGNVSALKMALAIRNFKKKGGKIDKQPDNVEKWWGQLSPEDRKRAKNIAQYKKDKKK